MISHVSTVLVCHWRNMGKATSRERLLAILRGEIPDCVPCCPDVSNMVPARLTGKPFWDVYLFQDPPLWKAHIDAIRHFDIDGGFELYGLPLFLDEEEIAQSAREERIVARRADGSYITQVFRTQTGGWDERVTLYTADNPPVGNLRPESLGLSSTPRTWEPVRAKKWPTGVELWNLVRTEMGEHGVVGVGCGTTVILSSEEDVYAWHDDPEPFRRRSREMLARVEKRMEAIAKLKPRPDFIMCGGSGTLIFQTLAAFRELALPILKRVTMLARDIGIPTHVHSCGPEAALVKIAVEETHLAVIDPLETRPMGDCNLAELKTLYGKKIILKGNLHTTDVMLRGDRDTVIAASRKAIDDAGTGGGFILSTGDQCGRDTPDENIRAMVETARTYGKY